MLTGVVSEHGTGLAAAIPGYHVAGKTGTAAKALPDGGGYSTSKYVASFVGFVPPRRPRLVILVTVDEPTTIWAASSRPRRSRSSPASPFNTSKSPRTRP
jgi:cell division protein FtsI/penicillin-binding protein 2